MNLPKRSYYRYVCIGEKNLCMCSVRDYLWFQASTEGHRMGLTDEGDCCIVQCGYKHNFWIQAILSSGPLQPLTRYVIISQLLDISGTNVLIGKMQTNIVPNSSSVKVNWKEQCRQMTQHRWTLIRWLPWLSLHSGSVRGVGSLNLNWQACKEGLVFPVSHMGRLRIREDNQLAQGHTASEHQNQRFNECPLGARLLLSAHNMPGELWVTCSWPDPSPKSPLQQDRATAHCWHSCTDRRCLHGSVMGLVAFVP